ncbi:LLM class flavin-dependent oxidoreductase [Gordonia amarae]|uniref:LLM class flavin-dependent oxidoreductase n=1 Tax=Gordonia amarae TaxID=36821 RepID=A0A857LSD9_9ACTN|nr:LLM class flavin-dependent oxidoreductase [Gordonia amarae]MCS3880489.1 alkanesulfonate monooxygenase SsuD/methylene tetrahydromethanopterin reductase-like flavin-dependent oxidoreductase (luciferase family) [Gordonia amarae]QHN18819.1 LLM class flavin-dependent oxidoreductase [Gordonia amarae]QHN23294.1 LLM class flavin-dependent oxidoreductase [Gordonia amarae]QHN32195.1 LLM class flavin-dependent oxidoreductase [Gordonia amarae]QHN40942.1 LLM class flavin-dependent oxidoreductase [Gordon
MSAPPVSGPLVLIALPRPLLAEVLRPGYPQAPADLGRRLDAVAHAVILGSDLLEPNTVTDTAGLDPSVAAITLAAHTRRTGLVIAAAAHRDHPYNLARRVAGVDHATNGRAGLAIAEADPAATPGNPWTRGDSPVAPDAVTAIRELWRSFPADAIIADRDSGVFAESERIVAIDHRGAYDITGPFQVPTSPQVWPPVFVSGLATKELVRVADVVVPVDAGDAGVVVYRPADALELDELLTVLPAVPEGRSATLRSAFGLAAPAAHPAGRAVFPAATTPEVSRA